ncbi:hypothetical protein CYMTET_55281 [Cymbomonas tetramitiformis]|uniref:Uncharacterized protein n=1 Tax=Cymbomonas tetramitiformis TaxID=36881 RepID=A0AAE0ENI8_9CHLO|nr:hypothetical protein CYMTET_55281 [Cymbomonas tetramitiformis]
MSADCRDAPRVLSASARPFEPSTRGAAGPTPFFVLRSADRASGSWRAKGGGGTVQRSLEEQYILAAVAPEPPEPTTPLSTPVMVNLDKKKKHPFDEALYLVAAATPTPPEPTTKKKLGEQMSAAIEKLTTPKLRSKVAVVTTDILRRTLAAIEKLTTPKLRSKVAVATTDILGTSSRSSIFALVEFALCLTLHPYPLRRKRWTKFLREWRRVLLHLLQLFRQLRCRLLHRLRQSPGETGVGLRTSLRGIPGRGFGLLAGQGGGGTVQRSLEEQYILAAVAPEPPEPTTPLSTPVMVNLDKKKKHPFDEALYLVAAATPTPPEPTTKKKLGEQMSAAIEKLTTPKLRSKVAVVTTDILRRTLAAIEKLTTPKLRSKVAVATTDILGTSSRSSVGEPRVQQPVKDTKVIQHAIR